MEIQKKNLVAELRKIAGKIERDSTEMIDAEEVFKYRTGKRVVKVKVTDMGYYSLELTYEYKEDKAK